MNYLSIFLASFLVGFSGSIAPGPLLAAVIYESGHKGAKTGPLFILGHGILEIITVILIITGIANFLNNALAIKSIAITGAMIMCIMGISMLRGAARVSLTRHPTASSSRSLVLKGITISLANPYFAIWWLTIGLGMVLGARNYGVLGIICFTLGHILADLSWYSFISFSVAKGKRFLSTKAYQWIMRVCALLLVLFGVYFFWSAFNVRY